MILMILLIQFIITISINSIKEVCLKFTDSFKDGNKWYVEGFIQAFNNDLNNIFDREYSINKPIPVPLNTVKTINRLAYLTD